MHEIGSLAPSLLGWVLCGGAALEVGIGVGRSLHAWVGQRRDLRIRQQAFRDQLARIGTRLERRSAPRAAWEGGRKFRIHWKVRESADCYSLYLVPHDGQPLASFLPGQYLTLHVRIPGKPTPAVRCYSLSDAPRRDYYRLTIKQQGLVSRMLTEQMGEGDLLDAWAPRGTFHLDLLQTRPVVLIGGGIGITPLLSMLNTTVEQQPYREMILLYGVRDGAHHPFKRHLQTLEAQHPQVRVITWYSAPRPRDHEGVDYNHRGRLAIESIRQVLPSSNYIFYVCGPSGFMQSICHGLQAWGVPDADVHTEAFGASSVAPSRAGDQQKSSPSLRREVHFVRSDKRAEWNNPEQSLLDLACLAGVAIDAGCRAGHCGTCLTALRAGSVEYPQPPSLDPPPGTCLPCVARPATSVTLDA